MADNETQEKSSVRLRRNRSRKERVQRKLGELFNRLGEEQIQREEAEVERNEWKARLKAAEERIRELERDLAKAKEENALRGVEVSALRSIRLRPPLLPRESVPGERVGEVKPRVVATPAASALARMDVRAKASVLERLGPPPRPLISMEEWENDSVSWDDEFEMRRSPPLPAFTPEREAERSRRTPIDWEAFRT